MISKTGFLTNMVIAIKGIDFVKKKLIMILTFYEELTAHEVSRVQNFLSQENIKYMMQQKRKED